MGQLDALYTITGQIAYSWQRHLFGEFLSGRIRDALDVPTGLGKTSVMGLWLTARALGAQVPRRLAYVVDRRVVVDQASREAERLADHLENALRGEIPEAVAEIWRKNLGLARNRLPVSTLRGQFADNRSWLENPAGAAIVVGTVDMIGSRLLFQGYGIGSRMRPVHAALLGNDTLLVLDEAHLIQPFKTLARGVAKFHRLEPVRGFQVMALSSTGSVEDGDSVFRLLPEHREDGPVAKRLNAAKRLKVHDTKDLAKALTDRAWELGQGGRRVLVFCNSRDKLARVVAEGLRKKSGELWKGQPGQPTVALLVGARRVAERELLTGRRSADGTRWEISPDPVFRRFIPEEAGETLGTPAFLIATSAGEVGIDLDADHLACDLVAWERMVQRLGRVNRTGRDEEALVDVFAAVPKDEPEDDVADQLDVLRAPFESHAWALGEDGRRQAGPGALESLREIAEFRALCEAATTAAPLRPELTPAVVESWAMTSIKSHPGRPNIEPWLRGWIDAEPQCRIVWRSVLPMRGDRPDRKLLNEFFNAFPPHLTEILETETYRVAETLKSRAAAVVKGGGNGELETLAAVVLDAQGEVQAMLTLGDLTRKYDGPLEGRTLVVDARLGGLSADGLLDSDSTEEPATLDGGKTAGGLWNDTLLEKIGRRLRTVDVGTGPIEGWVRDEAWPINPDDEPGFAMEWRVERFELAVTEGDAARSRTAQALDQHAEWIAIEAERIAGALALSEEETQMLVVAARSHDLGKARELWQTAMGAPKAGRPYAKTDGRRADGRALCGYRHEFGSLRDAESALAVIKSERLRDLARHLIAAHHGWARPTIAAIDPTDPPSLARERSVAAALRFARLQQEWGPWGLAWWETLLRAADWDASARQVEAEAEGGA